jgi:hypothetical protein
VNFILSNKQPIVGHLEGHFEKKLPDNNTALNHLHDKLGDFAKLWNAKDYYYPGTSIIQTSGSGKSKTVCALSQLGVFVVYCSFMGENASGYPKRSSVANILADAKDTTAEKENQFIHYYLFWLEELIKFLEKFEMEHGISTENMADVAIKFLNDRDKIMLSIKEKLKSKPIDRKKGRLNWVSNASLVVIDFENLVKKLSRFFALKPQKDLANPNRLHILFVFDEARELIPKSHSHPFDGMRRMASYFPDDSGLFVVLLDTALKVSNMAPDTFHGPSARVSFSKNKLFAPIYTIATMDIFREKNYQKYSMNSLFEPQVRYRFGRPLWGALMIPSDDQPSSNLGHMSERNRYLLRGFS